MGLGKKNGPNAPSSVQRSETLDMPFMPNNATGSGDGGGGATPSVGDSGHGGGEGSSYYSRDAASSIHGETVRFEWVRLRPRQQQFPLRRDDVEVYGWGARAGERERGREKKRG